MHVIRPAKKKDIKAVYGLIRQLSSYGFSKEQFEDCYMYNIGKECVLVYEKDSCIFGCAVFDIHYKLHFSCKSLEIVNLIVDENNRGCGIGKELLKVLEHISLNNDCICIEVATDKQRDAAHRFYKKEGFVCSHYKLRKELA